MFTICTISMHVLIQSVIVKDTIMQIEKALMNDRLCVSKVSCKFCIPTICNFVGISL